ncbi:hypothetical protein [Gramella sp. KN1008]|uniref:hypothetical protein n=1 Tax=Gramella sp. KN1008 TaxID=2529298 RepID=UPI00103B74B7|nr:hypothetical protein [Gramella sp. KN1008]TBW29065.1 hypothetical protein EZJ28_04040 [Gramella sp. KN1008]
MGGLSLNRLLLSIGLLSLSMIAYQLSLMQYLSIVQWYHFAYMIIAIALLGFGTAGSFLALFRKRLLNSIEFVLPFSMGLSGIFMPFSIWLSGREFIKFDTYLLFVEQEEVWRLVLFELIFFVPFFFCALAIGLAFIRYTDRIGKLYFSNLVGSGLGGLVAVLFLWVASPLEIPFVTGFLALLAAVLILSKKRKLFLLITSVLAIILLAFSFSSPLSFNLSQYKGLSRTLDLPDTKIETQLNSPYGYVQYVSSPVLRYAPGLSLSYTGDVPVTDAVFNNGDWAGVVLKKPEDSEILNYTSFALVRELLEPKDVLVLNAGTGVKSHYFASSDSRRIFHVEPNEPVSEISLESTGILDNVEIFFQDGRSFLAESKRKYDLISLPDIGSFGGNAGLQAIQEDYLFTVEGFSMMYHQLKENGILSLTVWMDYPYRNSLKITATFAETLERNGIDDPTRQLIAVRSWNTITYLLKKTEFTQNQILTIQEFCERLSFDPLILPGISLEERTRYNSLQDESLFLYTDILLDEKREELYESYDFNIRPATDDQPYFSQFLKWQSFRHLQKLFGDQSASFFELGYLIVLVTFFQSVVLAILLIILPLFFLRGKLKKRTWILLYFSGLGLGFMFVEMVLIQRFILFLGHPVYSVAAVISAMLLFSGFGSWLSSRFERHLGSIKTVLVIIVGTLLLYSISLPWLIEVGMSANFGFRILLSLILIGLPAFFMGMPFPLGLSYLSARNESGVPWAWGINGCLSVISTSLATIIAVEAGFSIIMILAALAYLLTLGTCFVKN